MEEERTLNSLPRHMKDGRVLLNSPPIRLLGSSILFSLSALSLPENIRRIGFVLPSLRIPGTIPEQETFHRFV